MQPAPDVQDVDALGEGKLCHYSRQPCMRGECARWRFISGMDPQTGQRIRRWDCGDNGDQFLLLEQNKLLHELNAEISTMRAESYISMETLLLGVGRPDILAKLQERRDHARAINRTDELLAERAGKIARLPGA